MCSGRNAANQSFVCVAGGVRTEFADVLDALETAKGQPGPFIVLRVEDGALMASRGKARDFPSLHALAKSVPAEGSAEVTPWDLDSSAERKGKARKTWRPRNAAQ